MNHHWKLTLVAVIAAAFLNLPLGKNAAGQTMPRSDLKTITLGLISNIHQKEIAAHFSDFIDYVARKLLLIRLFQQTPIGCVYP